MFRVIDGRGGRQVMFTRDLKSVEAAKSFARSKKLCWWQYTIVDCESGQIFTPGVNV